MSQKDRLAIMTEREDELAEKEYKIPFVDLPGDIKQNIHNAVLKEFGLRQRFNFKCMECKKAYQEDVEGDIVEEYLNILEETHTRFLESVCPTCKKNKEQREQDAELLANAEMVFGNGREKVRSV